jgi:fibrillarin-like pre-rRNA processing protein
MAMKELYPGVYISKGRLYTQSLAPGIRVYGERIIKWRGFELREWSPWHSKLAAALKKGLKQMPIKKGTIILYLGIAEGTTASHISDIVGAEGLIVGIDISKKSMRKLLLICESRPNIVPVLADAGKPESYPKELSELQVEVLYQDVSQKHQVEIFTKNALRFLKKDGYGMLALKAQSISSTKNANSIFKEQELLLRKYFIIKERIPLQPFQKDHIFYILRQR